MKEKLSFNAFLFVAFENFIFLLLWAPQVAFSQQIAIGEGTGFFISQDGYIATNHHVIYNRKERKNYVDFAIKGINGDFNSTYYAKLIAWDELNDLAILKVDVQLEKPLPYSFQQDVELYSDLFIMGYPLGSTLSLSAKPTEGKLTDNQGLNGEINKYLYDIKTEPGNSGSPIFSRESGNVVAVHVQAIGNSKDSYNRGIKILHLKELAQANKLGIDMYLRSSRMKGKSFKEQANIAKDYVVLIESWPVHHDQERHRFESLVGLADKAYDNKNYLQANAYYQEATKAYPQDPHVISRLAQLDKILVRTSNSYLDLGEQHIARKEYQLAKKNLDKAIVIYPNNVNASLRLKELNNEMEQEFQRSLRSGDTYYENEDYEYAKSSYQKALEIYPNNSMAKNKLEDTMMMIGFLKDRNSVYYDYKSLNDYDYNRISREITELLNSERNNNGSYTAVLVFTRDLNGVTSFRLNNTKKSGIDLTPKFESFADKISLQVSTKNNYEVQAEATFKISLEATAESKKVERTGRMLSAYSGNERIADLVNKGPMGIYTLNLNYGKINGEAFEQNEVVKFKAKGGPSNAFKSIIVPGLGVKPVTGGQKNGIGRTVFAYGLLGAGIGCKIYSNTQYDHYQKATEQSEIDKYYKTAKNANYAFYGFAVAAGAMWIYDIVWVASKGLKNQARAKRYKRSISLGVQPNSQSFSMALNYRF